ncbi:hypothetical protein D3C81_1367230 [compost metagenome]
MIMKRLFCCQLIPRHIAAVLAELAFGHVAFLLTGVPKFFAIVDNRLSLGRNLKGRCNFQLAFVPAHIFGQESILIMAAQELSHGLGVIDLGFAVLHVSVGVIDFTVSKILGCILESEIQQSIHLPGLEHISVVVNRTAEIFANQFEFRINCSQCVLECFPCCTVNVLNRIHTEIVDRIAAVRTCVVQPA